MVTGHITPLVTTSAGHREVQPGLSVDNVGGQIQEWLESGSALVSNMRKSLVFSAVMH